MPAKGKTVGAIPGYSGHVPFMRNHLIGRSYTPATIRSADCSKHFRNDDYPSALPLTIESRPQGRDYLYAQASKPPDQDGKKHAIVPRVSKRRPPIETHHASGMMDVRQMKTVVGTTEDCVTKAYKTTSVSELPYKDRSLHLHKPHDPMEIPTPAIKTIPGYTGHQHATQHIFARSYGSTGREIILDNQTADKTTAKELLYYDDPRPVGKILVEKHKMPGYQVPHFKIISECGRVLQKENKSSPLVLALRSPKGVVNLNSAHTYIHTYVQLHKHMHRKLSKNKKKNLFLHGFHIILMT